MRRILSNLMCSVLAFYMWAAHAYCADISFEPLSSRTLPSNFVKYLYQDSEGFVWIATNNGLARYDGRHTVSYGSRLEGYSFIYEIIEDLPGTLLLATDKGLVSLDKVSMQMSVLVNDFSVSAIIRDSQGNIWAGGGDGLLCRRAGEETFSKIALSIGDEPVVGLIDLIEGEDGRILMTTWHKGLYLYDPADGSTAVFRDGELAYSYVLHRDSQGIIWVGTWGKGLLRLDEDFMSTSAYEAFHAVPFNRNALLDDVIYVINDCGDNVLVGGQKGLSILSRSTGEFHSFSVDNGLPYNQVNTVLVTGNENVYLGLYGGGMCLVHMDDLPYALDELQTIKDKFGTATVNSMCSDGDRRLWLGVPDQAFVIYDSERRTVVTYDDLPAFRDVNVISTAVDIEIRSLTGEICIGTFSEGLLVYDPDAETVKVYSAKTSCLRSDSILALENDRDGNLWIGTSQGMYVLDRRDVLLPMNEFLEQCPEESASDNVTDISCAQDGRIFFAASEKGVAEIDLQSGMVRYFTDEHDSGVVFQNVLLGPSGGLWAGTVNHGLYWLGSDRRSFVRRNPISELSSQSIYNLVALPDGEIWLTTDNDVVSFRETEDAAGMEVTRYVSDLDITFTDASMLHSGESVAFGATDGIFTMSLSGGQAVEQPQSELVITDFIVNGQSYWDSEALDEDINYVSEIKVKNGDNVEIRYALTDYNHCFSPVYHCTCDDLSWTTAEETLTFKVSKVKNVVEIGHPASGQTKMLVIKARAYWQYAVIFLVIIVLGLLYLSYRLYVRKPVQKEDGSKDEHDVIAFEINSANVVSTDQEFLEKAMSVISRHLNDADFSQSDFIGEMGMSRTLLTDKIKKLTGFTPNALILEIRLKTAYSTIMSAQDKLRISDVAYSVGFNDAKYFSTCFRKKYGMTPKELMQQRLDTLNPAAPDNTDKTV